MGRRRLVGAVLLVLLHHGLQSLAHRLTATSRVEPAAVEGRAGGRADQRALTIGSRSRP
jgi:hypothetical protein